MQADATERKQEQLFRLIQSLKASERAYVRKFALKQADQSSPLFYLLDLIENARKKGHTLSDKILLPIWKKQYPAGQYPKVKSRLLQACLQALRSYDRANVPEEKIIDCLTFAEALAKRNLFKDAQQWLEKGVRLAEQLEVPELQLLLANRKHKYQLSSQNYWASKTQDSPWPALEQPTQQIVEHLRAEKAIYAVLHFQKTIGLPRTQNQLDQLEKIQAAPPFDDAYQTPSRGMALNIAIAQAGLAHLRGAPAEALQYCQEALAAPLSKRLQQKLCPVILTTYDSLLQSALLSFQPAIYEQHMAAFEEIPIFTERERQLQLGILQFCQAIYAMIGNRPTLVPSLLQNIDQVRSSPFIPNFRKVSCSYYCMLYPFMLAQWEVAEAQLHWLKNNKQLGVRRDIEIAIWCMESLLLWETKEFDRLEYQLRSFNEHLKARAQKYQMEETLIWFLRQLLQRPTIAKTFWREVRQRIEGILEQKPEEGGFFHSFDLLCWLESKEKKQRFWDAFYQKNIAPRLNT